MHRLIMGAKKGQMVDHINRDSLDNRKKNIRFCTYSVNMRNRQWGKSGITGVYWGVLEKKWRAQIGFNKKVYLIGWYDNKKNASVAYDNKLKELLANNR